MPSRLHSGAELDNSPHNSDHNGATHGFVYNNGIYTTIDDPLGANGTLATGINDAGQVVGYVWLAISIITVSSQSSLIKGSA